MPDDSVLVERRDDGVAVVTPRQPEGERAVAASCSRQLASAAAVAHRRPARRGRRTGGERIFAAGADISEFGGPDEARAIGGLFRDALDAVADIPRSTIAAITGYALGGGCELALACDFRIAADEAELGQPEILLGIIPGGGGTQRLPRLVGPAPGQGLIMSPAARSAPTRRCASGSSTRSSPHDEVLDRALAEGRRARAPAPSSRRAARSAAIDGASTTTLGVGPRPRAASCSSRCSTTDDARSACESFLEHGPGKATFTGR